MNHHGISFNVDPDMTGFNAIVPCGLAGEPVASLAACLAAEGTPVPGVSEVAEAMVSHFGDLTGRMPFVARSGAGALPSDWIPV